MDSPSRVFPSDLTQGVVAGSIFLGAVKGLLSLTALNLAESDHENPRAQFGIRVVPAEPPALRRRIVHGEAMLGEVEPFAGGATPVSVNLRVAAPVAGAEIDPSATAVVARNSRLFMPVYRMPQEKLRHTKPLSWRSRVQVCRIFVDS